MLIRGRVVSLAITWGAPHFGIQVLINTVWGGEAGGRGQTASMLAGVLYQTGHFDAVYTVEASTCRNIVLLAHRGKPRGSEQWRDMLAPTLSASRVGNMCPLVSEQCSPRLSTAVHEVTGAKQQMQDGVDGNPSM